MDKQVRILLLKILKFNGDVLPLIELGYDYYQIVNLIQIEIENKIVKRENGNLILTEKGDELLKSINEQLGRKNSFPWIEPEIASRISVFNINDIFLPNQDELTFLIKKDELKF